MRKKDRNGENVRKLKVIHDYNQKMGGVDKNNAMVGNYSCIQKTYKLTTKVFFTFWKKLFLILSCCIERVNGKKSLWNTR